MAKATGTRASDSAMKTATSRTKGKLTIWSGSQFLAPARAQQRDRPGGEADRGRGDEQHEAGIQPVEAPLQHRRALAPKEGDEIGDLWHRGAERERAYGRP